MNTASRLLIALDTAEKKTLFIHDLVGAFVAVDVVVLK